MIYIYIHAYISRQITTTSRQHEILRFSHLAAIEDHIQMGFLFTLMNDQGQIWVIINGNFRYTRGTVLHKTT